MQCQSLPKALKHPKSCFAWRPSRYAGQHRRAHSATGPRWRRRKLWIHAGWHVKNAAEGAVQRFNYYVYLLVTSKALYDAKQLCQYAAYEGLQSLRYNPK